MRKVEPIRELDDIERMKDYLKSKNERNYVLIMCGLYSGMRISDIIPLQVKQVKGQAICQQSRVKKDFKSLHKRK